MRRKHFFFFFLVGCAFLLFTGCPSSLTDEAGVQSLARTALNPAALNDPPVTFSDYITLPYVDPISGETAYTSYYDLATGGRVTSADPWDFSVEYQGAGAFLKDSRLVFFHTNSGDSGPGDGGVWFTGEEDFAAVVSAGDAVTVFPADYDPYVVDVTRYAQDIGEDVYETPMNMMTY